MQTITVLPGSGKDGTCEGEHRGLYPGVLQCRRLPDPTVGL